MLEIAHPEGHRQRVKRLISHGQRHAVSLLKGDVIFQSFFPDLAASLVKHSLRQVKARDVFRLEGLMQLDGEVTRPCSDIKDVLWF